MKLNKKIPHYNLRKETKQDQVNCHDIKQGTEETTL